MRKELFMALVLVAVAASSFSLLSARLTSEDTSLRGYLSGMVAGVVGLVDDSQLIRINLYNRSIALLENGNLFMMVTAAGTGNPNNRTATPTGNFNILSKEKMHVSRLSKGRVYMPLAMRFYGGYYLHDVPLDASAGMSRITTRYSWGCIRMPSDRAQQIYDWTRIGTRVEIYWASLVKDAFSPTVYRLTEDGYREPIASETAFISRGYQWADIVVIPSAELTALPLGATLY